MKRYLSGIVMATLIAASAALLTVGCGKKPQSVKSSSDDKSAVCTDVVPADASAAGFVSTKRLIESRLVAKLKAAFPDEWAEMEKEFQQENIELNDFKGVAVAFAKISNGELSLGGAQLDFASAKLIDKFIAEMKKNSIPQLSVNGKPGCNVGDQTFAFQTGEKQIQVIHPMTGTPTALLTGGNHSEIADKLDLDAIISIALNADTLDAYREMAANLIEGMAQGAVKADDVRAIQYLTLSCNETGNNLSLILSISFANADAAERVGNFASDILSEKNDFGKQLMREIPPEIAASIKQKTDISTRGKAVTLTLKSDIDTLIEKAIKPIIAPINQRAKETQCMANLKNIGTNALVYASEHDGQFPASAGAGFTCPESGKPYRYLGSGLKDGSNGDLTLFYCESHTKGGKFLQCHTDGSVYSGVIVRKK